VVSSGVHCCEHLDLWHFKVMVTDPALAAEALRHKNIDKALPHQLNLRVLDEVTLLKPHVKWQHG
jgi:hypothetical protein